MSVDEQSPPTTLIAWVHRSRERPRSEPALPEPLADPREDFRIERRTARGYTVKAGEFFQIIDVAGRECSDFLAFSQEQLDRGPGTWTGRYHHANIDGHGLPRARSFLQIL